MFAKSLENTVIMGHDYKNITPLPSPLLPPAINAPVTALKKTDICAKFIQSVFMNDLFQARTLPDKRHRVPARVLLTIGWV
jgi:hypothetical protein